MNLRATLGYACTFLGVMLFGTSLHFAGEPAVAMSNAQKNVIAGVSAVGGGVLSLGVGRRLLTRRDEAPGDASEEAPESDRRA